jgi:fluoride exporter
MSLTNIIYVALGAAVGGVARYLTSLFLTPVPGTFPWATFVVNVCGSLIIGMLLYSERSPNESIRLLIGVGFCGGLTTLSTFSAETLQLFQMQREAIAFAYISASLICSLAATYAGYIIARQF